MDLAHVVVQPLRAGGAPERAAHVLEQPLHHVAALFLGDQHLVGLLLGIEIADPEIENVAGVGQIGETQVASVEVDGCTDCRPGYDRRWSTASTLSRVVAPALAITFGSSRTC